MKPHDSEEITSLNIDKNLEYLHDSERDGDSTWTFLQQVQQRDYNYKKYCNLKYKLPEPKEFQFFSSKIYDNYKNIGENNTIFEGDWRLLYRVKGNFIFRIFDGFFAELYFNAKNHFLLIVIKGTSSIGNVWSDIKNVGLGSKGGELNSAFTFGEKVRVLMNKFKCKPMLLITGHSLGGYLAQIITYTITYCFVDENGKVMSRKEPMDDFGIYTMVFDSPASLKQINSIHPRDPVQSERFRLPIVNFIIDVNIINSNTIVGQHLGQVISVKIFKDKNKSKTLKRTWKTKSTHGIKNFESIDLTQCRQVEYLSNKKTIQYNNRKILSCFFSSINVERLQKYLHCSAMSMELVNKLPKFEIVNSNVIFPNESVSPEEFIPRAHRFLAKFKDNLDSGVFYGKNIMDNALYKMWKEEMLKDDAQEFFLNKEWTQKVQSWKDGTTIGGFETYDEMCFVGCMLKNSIPDCYSFDYKPCIADNFKATNEVTLILIVKEKSQIISNRTRKRIKIVYLVLDSNADEKVTMNLSALDVKSQEQLKNTELQFMGNKVNVLDIFGHNLVEKLTIWNILNFKKDAVEKKNHFYSNQTVSGRWNRFESAIAFAQELMKKELQFVLIWSDAGMGKSTALWQIALTLQQELPNNWIVHINLFDIQTELWSAKDKLNSKDAAIEFVRTLELAEHKQDELLTEVFNIKLQEKKMMFLFDSLDEVCPFHREAVETFIALLRGTKLQIVLTTRPHEGQNFKNADFFKLEPLRRQQRRVFVFEKFKMLGRKPPSDPDKWLDSICESEDFWSLPLNLDMAASMYDADADVAQAIGSRGFKNIYEMFLTKSIKNTLKFKFDLEKNEHKAASMQMYKNNVEKFNELFEILAVCLIYHSGTINNLESYELQAKIATSGEEINRFSVAKLVNKFKFVSFLHRSYAEYLVAKVFLKCYQKDFNCQAIKLNNAQVKGIFLFKSFREIRQHICRILAESPSLKIDFVPHCLNGKENDSLQILIEENCYELYMQIKHSVNFSNYMFKNYMFENIYVLYIALKKAGKEFVKQLLKDGAKFEDVLFQPDVLPLAIEKGLHQEVKVHFDMLKYNWYTQIKAQRKVNKDSCENHAKFDDVSNRDGLAATKRPGQMSTLHFPIPPKLKNRRPFGDSPNDLMVSLPSVSNEANRKVKKGSCENHASLKLAEEQLEMRTILLLHAAEFASKDLVELFIEDGADVDIVDLKNKSDKTALYYAIRANNAEVCNLLIEKGANSTKALIWAAKFSRMELFDMIYKNIPSECKEERVRAVHFEAARTGNLDIFKHICGFPEADPLALNAIGETFLHEAALFGHLHCMPFILEYMNQSVTIRNRRGETVLMLALRFNLQEVVEWLLKHTAVIHAVDEEGSSFLHYMAECENIHGVQMSLDEGIDVNSQDNDGKTPLFGASKWSRREVGKYLLEKGANAEITDKYGNTCLHAACKSKSLPIVNLMLDLVPLNCTNNKGETPLHFAALEGNENIVEFLLEESKKRNLEPVHGEKIINLTKRIHELKWMNLSLDVLKIEILEWQYILKKYVQL